MDKKLDILPAQDWGVFDSERPFIIAGPCSAESEEQVLTTAAALKKCGVGVFRASLWKPRTHPGCFEGVGLQGMLWLKNVRRETGMKICIEVAGASHVKAALEAGIDMVWIGARTTANPFLVQEIAEALSGSDIPVLVKNPISPDIELWIGAIERLSRQGIRKIGAVHRGFATFRKIQYRNDPEWHMAISLRSRIPDIPFFCDPSHMAGDTRYVQELSQKALDFGLDGLMVESHCNPAAALSDAGQQLTPDELGRMLRSLNVRHGDSDEAGYRNAIEALRTKIDEIDADLVRSLSDRMEVSREIGRIKKRSNIAIVQAPRWEELMHRVLTDAQAKGMDPASVSSIFESIHQASVREQNKIIDSDDSEN